MQACDSCQNSHLQSHRAAIKLHRSDPVDGSDFLLIKYRLHCNGRLISNTQWQMYNVNDMQDIIDSNGNMLTKKEPKTICGFNCHHLAYEM